MTVKMMSALACASLLLLGCSGPSAGQMRSEEVTFKGVEGVELPGTLLIPDKTPAPFVVLFPGSGPTDRNGNQLPSVNTNVLKQIAEHLQKQGIGSFRYDKRVTAKGILQAPQDRDKLPGWMSWANHKADALAALKFVREREESIDDRVGLIGHSEGGLQTLSISGEANPAAVVLLATPGRPLDAILREQVISALIRQDPPASVREKYIAEVDRLIKEVKDKGKTTAVPDGLAALFNPMTDKFVRDLFKEDPVALAGALKCPTLVMNGEKDIQISPIEDAPLLFAALEKRPGGKQQLTIIPGVSHNFKPVKDVDKDTGFTGDLPKSMLEELASWLKTNL